MTTGCNSSGRLALAIAAILTAFAATCPNASLAHTAAMAPAKTAGATSPVIRVQQATCDSLWEERNAIYKAAGYCFRTQRAISTFGNAGCQYDNEADVPMRHSERQRIAAIRAAERDLGCTP